MSLVQLNDLPSGVFKAHEPVIGSHPLLAGARVPRFGNAMEWNLNGVIRRPANLPASAWTVVFSNELAEPSWNLLAREMSMIMFNPRHPAVIAAGVSLKPAPANPATALARLSHLRRMASWAEANGLPPQLAAWQEDDLRRLIQGLGEQLANNSIRNYMTTLKWLRQCSPALTDKGLHSDPWARKSARKASNVARGGVVSTPPIPPAQWFALIRAAWTYVHTFAPDILRAQRRYQELHDNATQVSGGTTRAWTDTSPTPPTPSRFIPEPATNTAECTGPCWCSCLAVRPLLSHTFSPAVTPPAVGESPSRGRRRNRTPHHYGRHRRPRNGPTRRRHQHPMASRARPPRSRAGTPHASKRLLCTGSGPVNDA